MKIEPTSPAQAPIRSKLVPPRLRGPTVLRPRVDQLLDDAGTSAVTLVSAPPGYGKAIAVAAWLTARRPAAAWVTLDTHDEDPVRLWSYIITGVEQVLGGVGAGARRRLGAPDNPAEPAIEVLAAELADDGRPLTIVLDDLDQIAGSRSLATVIHAVRALPNSVRLVLIARADPELPLPRWRANGALAELRAPELAFTCDEARELLAATERIELSDDELEALVERTEGWGVALHLAALRMRTTGGSLDQISGRQTNVAHYLASEVLAGLDDDLRAFLAETSVLPRLFAGLCDHVREASDSAQLLERVAQENMFLVALDEEGEWYRYQSLFGEYLRARLDASAAVPLHRRASAWFRAHGLIEEAVEQAAACGDPETVAELLEEHHLALSRSGRAATIERWIAVLPQELLTARPGVLTAGVLAAGGCANARDEARRLLTLADRTRMADPARWTGYHETARLLLHALYGDDDVAGALAFARAAVALARAEADALEVPALAMESLALALGGSLEAADELARQAIILPGAAVSPLGTVGALSVRAMVSARGERPRVAATLAERALRTAQEAGVGESVPAACANFALAMAALAEGRPVAAERFLRRAYTVRSAIEGGALHAWFQTVLADVLAQRGRLALAERELGEARELIAGCADAGCIGDYADETEQRLEDLRTGAAAPVERLSKSEVAVLRLFDGNRSAREIGAELYLSLNTVKTHIRAIYRKLGVGSREEALARAQELGML